MPVIKATKTLKAIDQHIKADGGNEFRKQLKLAIVEIDDAYRSDEKQEHRSHLGGSMIGRDCPRALWYVFRWAKYIHHIPRMLRLFNRGHLEEARFVALLRQAGMTVWQSDSNGKQFRVSGHGGHFGSAIDGVIGECPDLPENVRALGEFKTHNAKSFAKLEKEGVRGAKYEHFIQMQIYMAFYRLPFAIYLAVNKDDDSLWAEIIPFEQEIAAQYWDRAGFIVFAEQPPAKISASSTAFGCKFCDFREICHKGHQPDRNCRTCVHSFPSPDGGQQWGCRKHQCWLTKEQQLVGCHQYQLREDMCSASSS